MVDARIQIVDFVTAQTTNFEQLPSISWKYVLNDKGDVDFSIALSDPLLTRDAFAPKRSDFKVQVQYNTTGWETVHDGIISSVGLKNDEGLVHVKGLDYMWWLEQPWQYFMSSGAYSTLDWSTLNPNALYYFWPPGTDQQTIMSDILYNTWNLPGDSIVISPQFLGTGWGTVFNVSDLAFAAGETATALDMIKAVGALNDPYGFEFHMSVGSVLTMIAPRKVTQANPGTAVGTFSPSGLGVNDALVEIDWSNEGPTAISTVGMPPSGIGMHGWSTYAPSAEVYRNWLEIVQFNDAYRMRNQTFVNAATDSIGTLHRNPQKKLTIQVKPDLVNSDEKYFFRSQVGNAVWVDSEQWFMPYHRIEAWFTILSQEITTDNDANWLCTLTLEQIYQ